MRGEVPMADLDYSFAPAPHNMATDRDLSAEAFRLWSIIHLLKWNHIEPTPDALAQAMGAHKRSIMRWLNELEDRQWIAWNRHNPNPNRRILLRSNAGSPDALVLEHIKDILSSDNPSIEAIRDAMQSDPPDTTDPSNTPSVPRNGDPTITSDTPVTSDSPGTSDTSVTCDSPVTRARGVTCGDRRVTESDSPVTCGDSTITRSDSCVTSPSFSDRPDASKPDSSEGGGSGGSRSRHRKRSTTAPLTPPTSRRLKPRSG